MMIKSGDCSAAAAIKLSARRWNLISTPSASAVARIFAAKSMSSTAARIVLDMIVRAVGKHRLRYDPRTTKLLAMATAIPPLKESEKIEFGDPPSGNQTGQGDEQNVSTIVVASYNI